MSLAMYGPHQKARKDSNNYVNSDSGDTTYGSIGGVKDISEVGGDLGFNTFNYSAPKTETLSTNYDPNKSEDNALYKTFKNLGDETKKEDEETSLLSRMDGKKEEEKRQNSQSSSSDEEEKNKRMDDDENLDDIVTIKNQMSRYF